MASTAPRYAAQRYERTEWLSRAGEQYSVATSRAERQAGVSGRSGSTSWTVAADRNGAAISPSRARGAAVTTNLAPWYCDPLSSRIRQYHGARFVVTAAVLEFSTSL